MDVEFTADAVAQLGKLPSVIVGRMDAVVERLKEWPNLSGAKPLKKELKKATSASEPETTVSSFGSKEIASSSGG
jgi:hypothetical protein